MKALYVVAVSGGVDSIVLLDMLVKANDAELVVAHVDHGIRAESGADATFVRTCAQMYTLPFESIQLGLGAGASEDLARTHRWQFLREIKERYEAEKIVTAHHADDIVETMIINLLRGTGWRGIATLRETDEIKRPLLSMRKQEILAYAEERGLEWRDDATNADEKYRRNYVRHNIIPRMSDQQFDEFVRLHTQQLKVRECIEREAADLSPTLLRYEFTMWPDEVAHEMLRVLVGSLTRPEYDRALSFIRIGRPAKRLQLSNGKIIELKRREFIVSGQEDC